jgi:hypothetical protein
VIHLETYFSGSLLYPVIPFFTIYGGMLSPLRAETDADSFKPAVTRLF